MKESFKLIAQIAVVIAAVIAIIYGTVALDRATQSNAAPSYAIDTSNEKRMHDLGIPTKKDVEMWHRYGRWGYSTENVMHTEHVYTELPGSVEAWDEFYGIEAKEK